MYTYHNSFGAFEARYLIDLKHVRQKKSVFGWQYGFKP
jgi:hypothetical protein